MKIYLNKISASLSIFLLLIFLIIGHNSGYAQVKIDFKPRESAKAPKPYTNVKNYNLQGDFTMIGNTNLTLKKYKETGKAGGNNNEMIYVDIDNDKNTKNSSSAELVLPGGECTEIVYAGLYWTGRAHDIDIWGVESPMTFDGLDKRKVKLKAQGKSYQEIVAKDTDIYYPKNSEGAMYAAYADVTDYVRENGSSNYFVADIALKQGKGGGTGFYGGWGMVIVYKNTSMKWKDITVFDGYGYMNKTTGDAILPVSGFRATQHGDVKVKMGMMAGEGDEDISGDYFKIQKGNTSTYQSLSHGENSINNFFNSSIYTGGNNRNPYLKNNTGMDISMFELDNRNNQIIRNNQSSTSFSYGSNQDTYIIFNIVFAVDAYVPDIVGENKATDYGGVKPLNNGKITPGQEFEFELDVYNKGTEAVNNSKIEIPVPFNLHYSSSTITGGLSAIGEVEWIPPVGGTNDPNVTAGGTIVWKIGNLPLDTTKEKLLAQLKYRFKVSDNCILLSTNECGLEVKINGKISGVGATSKSQVNSDLVRDYGNGVCAGPVYDDFISTITVSADFLQNCNPPVEDGIMKFKAFCSVPSTGYNRGDIVKMYPKGSKFYSKQPGTYTSNDGLISEDFPVNSDGSGKLYYVMVPGMEDGCYAKLEISVDKVTTSPTVNDVTICFGESIVLENELSDIGKKQNYSLVYFDSKQNEMESIPNPSSVGTHKYFVAEGKDGCLGPKKEFTIVINPLPEVSKSIENIVLCENFDSQTISITTNVSNYKWEYSATGSGDWSELNNTTFSNVIILEEKSIKVNHATKVLDGLRIRLNVTNDKCSDTSNEFEIKVNDCSAVTNPMLLNQGISN